MNPAWINGNEGKTSLAADTITTATYQARLTRVLAEMAKQGVDTLIVGPSADLIYLTGFDAHVSERLNLLIIRQSGSLDFVAPFFEVPVLGEHAGDLVTLHTWNDGEDPIALAASKIEGKVAVGSWLASAFLIRLQHATSGDWIEAGPILKELRMIKDEYEIEALQAAASRTDAAWEEFIVTASITGLTEVEARQILLDLTARHGVFDPHGICASGPNAASPHHHTGDRKIQPGDAVIFDWGGTVDGYYSDVTRTVHVGEPGEEFIRCYDIVRRANQAALEAMVPGVPLESIDAAARDLITKEGYGEAFLHRVGHGLGLEIHEDPYLVRGSGIALEPGMVFSDEPGIYLEGKFGIRIEDSVLATPEGGVRLNEGTRDLIVMK
jgi:Xaa-Pro aminopeptidase